LSKNSAGHLWFKNFDFVLSALLNTKRVDVLNLWDRILGAVRVRVEPLTLLAVSHRVIIDRIQLPTSHERRPLVGERWTIVREGRPLVRF